jgi:hypothetical protein
VGSLESIDHLFLHCEFAIELWNSILQLFGVDWVMPRKMSNLLGSWRGQFGTRHALQIWKLASLCLMWCLWREWNAWSFEDRESVLLKIKKMML